LRHFLYTQLMKIDGKSSKVLSPLQLKHIESSDFDGNFRKVVINELSHPYGVAVKDNTIYWTDWKTKALHVSDLDRITRKHTIANNLEGLMEVKIVEHEPKQVEKNACGTNNGGCSHLCLRKPNGFSCKCPTGIKLKAGSQTECEALPDVSFWRPTFWFFH
jgi:low-density lipoprotein receptor-related protein 4